MLVPSAGAAVYPLSAGQNLVGETAVYVAHGNDTLLDLARAYDLGFTQLAAANPHVDPWLPGEGTRVVLPMTYLVPDASLLPDGWRRGIVINLAEKRLFYFPPTHDRVETFPIGVGVQGWDTPLGETRVTRKTIHPTWYPPASIRATEPGLPKVVPPGPDNPLGAYALHLGWPGYLIHDTNKPDGVGRNVSHGCIHLYPEDIAILFRQVPVGTPVRVIDDEAQLAWVDGELFLQVYLNKAQTEQLDVYGHFDAAPIADLEARIARIAGTQVDRIDWTTVRQAALERSGLPVRITLLPSAANPVRSRADQ
jgi:L,D-transpeptidase ErfK/SrfK